MSFPINLKEDFTLGKAYITEFRQHALKRQICDKGGTSAALRVLYSNSSLFGRTVKSPKNRTWKMENKKGKRWAGKPPWLLVASATPSGPDAFPWGEQKHSYVSSTRISNSQVHGPELRDYPILAWGKDELETSPGTHTGAPSHLIWEPAGAHGPHMQPEKFIHTTRLEGAAQDLWSSEGLWSLLWQTVWLLLNSFPDIRSENN